MEHKGKQSVANPNMYIHSGITIKLEKTTEDEVFVYSRLIVDSPGKGKRRVHHIKWKNWWEDLVFGTVILCYLEARSWSSIECDASPSTAETCPSLSATNSSPLFCRSR